MNDHQRSPAVAHPEKLVEEFARSVAAQTAAIEAGDARTGNQFAKRYVRAFEKLRELGDPGRDALVSLFSHPRIDVRVAAAAFLLRYRHEEATAVLRQASEEEGISAFEAGEALKRWDEGAWNLDPP